MIRVGIGNRVWVRVGVVIGITVKVKCVFLLRGGIFVCVSVYFVVCGVAFILFCVCACGWEKKGGVEEGVIFIISLRTFLSFAKFLLK